MFDARAFTVGLRELDDDTAMFELARRIQQARKEDWGLPEFEAAILLLNRIAKERKQQRRLTVRSPNTQSEEYLGTCTKDLLEKLAPIVKRKREAEKLAKYKEDIENELSQPRFGYACLTPEEKGECHQLLIQIRDIIQRSNLDTEKKNAISGRLSALSSEIDKDVTPVEGFSALWGDFIITYNSLADMAMPAVEKTKKLVGIIFNRSAEDQGLQLPAPKQMPMLEDKQREAKE